MKSPPVIEVARPPPSETAHGEEPTTCTLIDELVTGYNPARPALP